MGKNSKLGIISIIFGIIATSIIIFIITIGWGPLAQHVILEYLYIVFTIFGILSVFIGEIAYCIKKDKLGIIGFSIGLITLIFGSHPILSLIVIVCFCIIVLFFCTRYYIQEKKK